MAVTGFVPDAVDVVSRTTRRTERNTVDSSPVTIAVAQLAITIGEPDANRQAAAGAVAEAAAAGARLVVLPELCDSGYVFGDDADKASAEARSLASRVGDSITLRQWRALAVAHQVVIVGGFCELGGDDRLYNSAAVVDASGTRAVYRKAHLWDKEKLVFTPGDAQPALVDLDFGRIAVMICYDLEFPEWVRLAALAGADLIAAPVNWPAASSPAASWPAGERPAEVIKAQAAAATNGVFVAVADRSRTERGVDWISGSVLRVSSPVFFHVHSCKDNRTIVDDHNESLDSFAFRILMIFCKPTRDLDCQIARRIRRTMLNHFGERGL